MTTADSAGNTRYPLIDAASADTLVVHCSDPRFRDAFQGFVRQGLGIGNPMMVVVPGGIHDLVTQGREDAAAHLTDQLGFMLQLTKARRLILFDHDDCRWQKRWAGPWQKRWAGDPDGALKKAAGELGRLNSGVEISTYRAQIDGAEIRFLRV
jgi:hypothetical protein